MERKNDLVLVDRRPPSTDVSNFEELVQPEGRLYSGHITAITPTSRGTGSRYQEKPPRDLRDVTFIAPPRVK